MLFTLVVNHQVLDEGAAAIGVGVTTDEIDRVVHEACMERDCYPSPLNYYTFPKSCCTSVNEVICHGIPDARPLVNGDIVNLDVTVYHKGCWRVYVCLMGENFADPYVSRLKSLDDDYDG